MSDLPSRKESGVPLGRPVPGGGVCVQGGQGGGADEGSDRKTDWEVEAPGPSGWREAVVRKEPGAGHGARGANAGLAQGPFFSQARGHNRAWGLNQTLG